jgi:Uncharacterized alpha/beta hydrolase domain (DUF2235)
LTFDPGLGSQADGTNIFSKALRWIHNTVAQATGFGITRNLIDCYAAIIQWRPSLGDSITSSTQTGFSVHTAAARSRGGSS